MKSRQERVPPTTEEGGQGDSTKGQAERGKERRCFSSQDQKASRINNKERRPWAKRLTTYAGKRSKASKNMKKKKGSYSFRIKRGCTHLPGRNRKMRSKHLRIQSAGGRGRKSIRRGNVSNKKENSGL